MTKVPITLIDYAVVHKTRENGRIINVETKIVFGTEASVAKKLERSVSNKINTAYIERSNGTLRLYDSNLQRKTIKFAKEKKLLEAKVKITIAYYNFVKVHASLSRNEDKSYTE
jgi:hypothetical protein